RGMIILTEQDCCRLVYSALYVAYLQMPEKIVKMIEAPGEHPLNIMKTPGKHPIMQKRRTEPVILVHPTPASVIRQWLSYAIILLTDGSLLRCGKPFSEHIVPQEWMEAIVSSGCYCYRQPPPFDTPRRPPSW